ncbi:hypothetical protein DF121_34215 [Burkholderia stagnalis]|nr:hypothetical protein DF145_33580 [Burkholderia stagnalis]RQX87138.1 hypothetical protein DF121_34215 [Burkholderia stagnalis]RQY07226.1 hypothetical protein DF115_34245 [Burkholderia stagnalis]RQY22282.1 hypothetical protein DF114_33995 [Burkholderia stagnalis]
MVGMNFTLLDRCMVAPGAERPPDLFHVARYWRIFMPVPNPVTPPEYLSIGRVWMYRRRQRLAYDGVNTAESSTYNGRSAALTFRPIPMANPQAVTDAWTSGIANPVNQWIEVDFGAEREVDEVVLVPLMFRNGIRNPQTLEIQCSDDGQAWIGLARAVALDWTDGEPKGFAINMPRLRIAPVSRWPGEQRKPVTVTGPGEL